MKRIIVIVSFILLGIGMVRADLSDSLFCSVKKDEVTISLKQTPGYYNCNDTIVSLEHLMIQTAKDLMKIQIYINNGRDVDYRSVIKTQKQDLIKKLQVAKTTITTHMNTFETTIIQKSVQYFIIRITPYKIRLQTSLVKIASLSGVATPALNSYALLLEAQVATIDALSEVTTQAELTDLLAKYVYFKKEIEGKSE